MTDTNAEADAEVDAEVGADVDADVDTSNGLSSPRERRCGANRFLVRLLLLPLTGPPGPPCLLLSREA